MARTDNEVRITLPLLDRLLDFEPEVTREAAKSRSKSMRELKQSVRRDLEWLLNTRCYPDEIDENLEEVNKSLAIFGLPDFTGVGSRNQNEHRRLVRSVETAIRIFDPRLMDLRVTLEQPSNMERTLNFRIEARLRVDPAPEPVVFDTVLQIGSGAYEVKEK